MPGASLTCDYLVEGDPSAPTLFFIHGWPDDASLWRYQVEALRGQFRCVSLTLPNFGDTPVKAGGFNFQELVSILARTLEESLSDGEKATLVTHDWGAYVGYLLEQAHPDRFGGMIALDVGGHAEAGSLKETLFIMGYQWSLIAAWLIGGVVPPLGNWMARRVAGVVRVPARQAARVRSRFAYPYFHLWRGLLLPWKRKTLLQRYRPACPVLYLWGRKKPVMFHSARWLEIVEQSGGRSEGLEGAGHWFMETHPDLVNDAIRDWAKNTPP